MNHDWNAVLVGSASNKVGSQITSSWFLRIMNRIDERKDIKFCGIFFSYVWSGLTLVNSGSSRVMIFEALGLLMKVKLMLECMTHE